MRNVYSILKKKRIYFYFIKNIQLEGSAKWLILSKNQINLQYFLKLICLVQNVLNFVTPSWSRKGKANRGNTISFGSFGLQAITPCWLNFRQIEAGRRAITRNIRRGGKVWIRVFPDKSVTMRAAETRMGSVKVYLLLGSCYQTWSCNLN